MQKSMIINFDPYSSQYNLSYNSGHVILMFKKKLPQPHPTAPRQDSLSLEHSIWSPFVIWFLLNLSLPTILLLPLILCSGPIEVL